MLMAGDSWNLFEDFLPTGDYSDSLSFDIDELCATLDGRSDPQCESLQNSPEDLLCTNVSEGQSTPVAVKHEQASHSQNGIQESEGDSPIGAEIPGSHLCHPSDYSELSDSRTGMGSECLFDCPENSGMVIDHGTSHCMMMDKSDFPFPNYSSKCGSSMEYLGALERNLCNSPVDRSIMNAEISLPNALYSELTRGQFSDKISEASGHRSPTFFCTHSSTGVNRSALADPSSQFPRDFPNPPFMSSNGENMTHIKDEVEDQWLPTQNTCQINKMSLGSLEGTTGVSVNSFPVPKMDNADINSCQGMSFKCEASDHCSSITGNPFSDATDGTFLELSLRHLLPGIQSSMSSKKEEVSVKDEKEDKLLTSKSTYYYSSEVIDEAASGYPSLISRDFSASIDVGQFVDHAPRQLLVPGIQSSTSRYMPHVDDEADICILEDISAPVHSSPSNGNSHVTSQCSSSGDSLHHMGMGSKRLKANDESFFRVALQETLPRSRMDLAQTESEASPPDGVLSVPLLRHQKIALSWMVQKETACLHCSGGILADDQGLGKTVSTIALILKERSPSSQMSSTTVKQGELEALNLDEDDSGVPELHGMKQDGDSGCATVNRSLKRENACMRVKGRPAAGTLVVCPTSVLRQWAEELHNKVTRKANLSILVYHGTNRTKDPYELAKYDVVLTTYSIVSMEVPKQPLGDKDDDEKRKEEAHGLLSMGLSSGRKRKYPESSDKKSLKDKKGIDGVSLESVSHPLARVAWFRVVLDEAQSIKNRRTQVARACWGLRAKRRWCLSGTPMQNAVDDLYSYFRFLRYDPFSVYQSFCSKIKDPINRNPTTGYKILQALLKTVMLRRTKGTLIDGKSIITLPPKSIELKKVDFSKEERDFYSRLEAESCAQFKEYADAGTVNQNYVNILLMLLRLRQACDHPFLVKGYDSTSVWRSSIEKAKKLSREKQIYLLNCLEDCSCGICNDSPEDTVVTICGHVFCNQCICEHLTGDDNLCPAAHCEVPLSTTSMFSRATLESSLSNQLGPDCSPNSSGSKFVETLEPCSEGLSDSSKIKAALKVLKSLSKPWDCTLKGNTLESSDGVASHPENRPDSHSGRSFKDMPNGRNVNIEKGLNDPNTKVAEMPEKAIVFSQWTGMLDLLEARLKSSSIQYRRLDGTMSVVARDKAVKDFNSLPEVTVMIMSLKAASLGLNMVAACHVILLDLWWNPTTEDQAIDRAHRIGQTRPVTVLRLTVKDTVEDRILALQEKKREMVASAFGEDEMGSRQTRLTVEDLQYLFMV